MSVSIKTELDDLFDRGIDVKKRRIYFGVWEGMEEDERPGDFSWTSCENAIRGLHRLADINPKKPIELHMASYGGDPYMMLGLYDAIQDCPCQVKFFGRGRIASSATWIMAGCDERYLYPNTIVMIHDGSTGEPGKHTDVQIDAKEDKRLQNQLDDMYVADSHMPVAFYRDVLQRDVYITAEEAVLIGLADKVLSPKKRGNLRRMRQAHMSKTPDKRKLNALLKRIHQRTDKPNKVKEITINVPQKEPSSPDIIIDESSADNKDILGIKENSDEKGVGKGEEKS